jgi:hypothetical protein
LTNGTLDMNSKNLTCGLFSSTNTNTRTLAFGTGQMYITGSGACWATGTSTNMAVTGTPIVNVTYNGATATSVSTGTLNEANSMSFNFTAGTYTLTFLQNISYTVKNVNFTGFSGTWFSISTGNVIYGNLTLSTGMTTPNSSPNVLTFGATSGTQQITTNGKTLDVPITFDGVGGTFQLQDAATVGSTRIVTLTNGTLDLNNNNLTCGAFTSSNSNVRTLAFGTGQMYLVDSNRTLYACASYTNFTITGTPIVNATYSGSVGTRSFNTGSDNTGSTAISVNVTAGSDIITVANASRYINFNFTGFSGTCGSFGAGIFGNLICSNTMTFSSNTVTLIFGGTSGTQLITTAGTTWDFPVSFYFGTGGASTATYQLQDSMIIGSTRTVQLNAGTLDLNNKSLTCGLINGTGSVARGIAFGTGNITLGGSNATIWQFGGANNLTFTGTPTVYANYAGSTGTRALSQATVGFTGTLPSVSVTTGSDSVNLGTGSFNSIDFTGFTGTWQNTSVKIQGNLNIASGMTLAAGATAVQISGSSAGGVKTITTNNQVLNFPLQFYGAGNTWVMSNALTIGSSYSFSISSGTMRFKAATTNTAGTFVIAGSGPSPATLNSTVSGTQYTLSQSSGTVSATFATIQDSNATGGATWTAATSTNAGNNTNWIFTGWPMVIQQGITIQGGITVGSN